jgi:hypothetical protein
MTWFFQHLDNPLTILTFTGLILAIPPVTRYLSPLVAAAAVLFQELISKLLWGIVDFFFPKKEIMGGNGSSILLAYLFHNA